MNICRILFVAIFATLSFSHTIAYETELKKLSQTMADKIIASKKSKIAVVDFSSLEGCVTQLGRFIAEEFAVNLAGADKGFTVVDRNQLNVLLKEIKLAHTGIIDPATAKQLGKVAGVEALITGTLTPFTDSVRIGIKILDVSTAEIIDASSGNLQKTKLVADLLGMELPDGCKSSVATGHGAPKARPTKITLEQSTQSHAQDNAALELYNCKAVGTTVICPISLKSTKYDTNFSFKSIKAFDDVADKYTGSGKFKDGTSYKRIPMGIKSPGLITLQNIPSHVTYFSLIEVYITIYSGSNMSAKFRNVSINRR